MQKIFPFLHSPLEATEFLALYEDLFRTGVASGSEVSAGSAGWLIDIDFGEVMIAGSHIDDDLAKIDAIDLGHPAGNDRHYVVYGTYSFTATDPPAAMVFASTAGATPPTLPTIPAGAVKLADIFIPVAADSINHASVRIVNAPKAHGPTKIIDTGEILERLIMSNGNTILFTTGTLTFDGPSQELRWTADLIFQAEVSYNREAFEALPLVRATLASGSSPLAIPGTPGSEDAIVYAIIDRSIPNLAATLTLKAIDLTASSPAELADFYDPLNQTKIITLGLVKDGKLHLSGSVGSLPALGGVPEGKVIAESPLGVSAFQNLKDSWIAGGFRAEDWNQNTYADKDAAMNGLVDVTRRKSGMVVSSRDYQTADDGVTSGSTTVNSVGITFTPEMVGFKVRVTGGTASLDILDEIEEFTDASNVKLFDTVPAGTGATVEVFESFEEELDGTDWVPWTPVHNSQASALGYGVVDGCSVTSPAASDDVVIGIGKFVDGNGKVIRINSPATVTITSDDTHVVFWDSDKLEFASISSVEGLKNWEDLPFAVVIRAAGAFNKLVDVRRRAAGSGTPLGRITIGSENFANNARIPTGFDNLYQALMHLNCYDDSDVVTPKRVEVINEAQVRYTADLVGTISITAGLLSDVNGVGTRFLTDFAPGDFIESGSEQQEVNTVVDDTTITLVNPWSSDFGANGYSRAAYIGPSSWMLDFAKPEWDGTADNRLSNMCICGGVTGLAPRPLLSWGTSGDDSDPFIDMASSSSPEGMSFEDVDLDYEGGSDATRSEHVFMKDPEIGFRMNNCSFNPGSLTHLFRWLTNTDLGGSGTSVETNGMVLENVTADDALTDDAASSAFRFDSDVIGRLTLRDFAYNNIGTDVDHLFDYGNVNRSGATMSLRIDGFVIRDIATSLFRHLDGVGGDNVPFSTAAKRMNNGKFINCGASVRVSQNIASVSQVSMNEVEFATAFSLAGGHLVEQCWASGGVAVEVRQNASVKNCDFHTDGSTVYAGSGLPGITDQFGAMRFEGDFSAQVGKNGARLSAAMSGIREDGTELDWLTSRIGRFMGLYPGVNAAEANVVLKAGTIILFPTGHTAWNSSDETVILNTGGATEDIATDLDAIDDTVYFFFARRDIATDSGLITQLHYSSNPPQSNGALNASDDPELQGPGGTVREDYRYVGFLVTGTLGAAGTNWLQTRQMHWPDGKRRVYLGVAEGDADRGDFIDTDIITGSSPQGPGTLALSGLNARLPTAREFGIRHRAIGREPSSGAQEMSWQTIQGDIIEVDTVSGDVSENHVFVTENVPRATSYTSAYNVTSSGNVDAVASLLVVWAEEDLNDLAPHTQTNGTG